MKEGGNWSRFEVEAAVSSYREMLHLELAGIPYNKRERNLALQKVIRRNASAIEFKHQNISAILNNSGVPYISGYKPRGNFQTLLEEIVAAHLIENPDINSLAAKVVQRQDFPKRGWKELLSIKVDPPSGIGQMPLYGGRLNEEFQPVAKRNYVEMENRNSALGLAGEKLIMEYEHERLWRAGHRELADRIEHVSVTKGDHLGYDVLSFEEDGKERLIEVKTTQFGQMTPFFASPNEVKVSNDHSDSYHLYRVFSFSRNAKLFSLEGALASTCELTPAAFRAVPR